MIRKLSEILSANKYKATIFQICLHPGGWWKSLQGLLIPLAVEEEVGEEVGEGVVVTEGEGGDVEVAGMVNPEVSLHPRAVRKFMRVHNWMKISLRTSDTLGSTSLSMRTFQSRWRVLTR